MYLCLHKLTSKYRKIIILIFSQTVYKAGRKSRVIISSFSTVGSAINFFIHSLKWYVLKKILLRPCWVFLNWVPFLFLVYASIKSSHTEVFLGKGAETCSKFTEEYPCRSAISIKLLCSFIEISLRHGCSPVNLLHNFRTPFLKNNSEWLLLRFPIM